MGTNVITKERAIAAGQLLQQGQASLMEAEQIRKLQGDTVASLYRVQALNEFREALNADDVKALIISAADHSYEVAESEKFKFTPEMKLKGAVMAMMKGCLLSDEAGPHFAVISGKGGLSVLVKEAGHRHKMRRIGVRQIDVKAAARMMRPRPNAPGKFDMIIDGEASCELNGEVYRVERKGDLPIILPCWDTDGPDGHEAKARRRLLRDLWAKVSGEFDAIEKDEIEAEYEQPMVEVIDHKPVRVATPPADEPAATDPPQGMEGWQEERRSLNHMLSKDPSEAATVMELWDAIAAAETMDALTEAGNRISDLKELFSARVVDALRRLWVYRQRVLKGGAT